MKTNRTAYIKNLFGKAEKRDQLQILIKDLNTKDVNSGMKVCLRYFRADDYILPSKFFSHLT